MLYAIKDPFHTIENLNINFSLIKEIEIFPCDESELPLKSILFNFPVYKDCGDVCGFLWDKSTHVSTCLEEIKKMPVEPGIPLAARVFIKRNSFLVIDIEHSTLIHDDQIHHIAPHALRHFFYGLAQTNKHLNSASIWSVVAVDAAVWLFHFGVFLQNLAERLHNKT